MSTIVSTHPVEAVAPPEWLDRARRLAPALRARRAETERRRCIPAETIADFHQAGFFRMLQPAAYGGWESDPGTFFEVQITLAEACPSSGWIMGVVGIHNWHLALFDKQAQEDVWGDDSRVLISSSYSPTGKVERVEEGFRVSGRWSYSSGCDHCDWVLLGGYAPVQEGAVPDMRSYLIPRKDYRIEDNWHVIGLKGTGSKDIVVDGAFVPEYRTHRFIDGFMQNNPGNAVNTAPLYRLPFGQVLVRAISTSAIGMAQGALKAFCQATAHKVAAGDGSRVAEDPAAQMAAAGATTLVDEMRVILHRNLDDMMQRVQRGERIPVDLRVQYRFDSANVVGKAVEAIDRLFTASGGRAIFAEHPLAGYFLDVHAARAHYVNVPEKAGRNLGRTLLNLPNQDFFL
ncbi:MAG: flavin-dependent monooxygenase [Planctomycetales bacterium]|nr:flavin-dependent monooxygenase [Planctomycetales bacterium]NIM09040.1 flavin-dependent monooxygenase [Planctomycetales bacterium]NIN08503.1 flavin-dependent monooxygenase [Planctomycetales bacterium]NIN77637.1 flavin-dependent monooxygenase [Planctomycetales bacterium]NIO34800.1 flavin-dependent monooxygenase [Planctomycetales bacterium]